MTTPTEEVIFTAERIAEMVEDGEDLKNIEVGCRDLESACKRLEKSCGNQ